jgi:hypothetical protein
MGAAAPRGLRMADDSDDSDLSEDDDIDDDDEDGSRCAALF